MKKSWFSIAALLAVAVASGPSKDEQQIRALVDRYSAAFKANDLDTIMKNYAPGPDLFALDVIPPRKYVGFEAYKKDWQDFFAAFPGPMDEFHVEDLQITTEGKLAFSHSAQDGILRARTARKWK